MDRQYSLFYGAWTVGKSSPNCVFSPQLPCFGAWLKCLWFGFEFWYDHLASFAGHGYFHGQYWLYAPKLWWYLHTCYLRWVSTLHLISLLPYLAYAMVSNSPWWSQLHRNCLGWSNLERSTISSQWGIHSERSCLIVLQGMFMTSKWKNNAPQQRTLISHAMAPVVSDWHFVFCLAWPAWVHCWA